MAYKTRRGHSQGGHQERTYEYNFLKPDSGFEFVDYYIPMENNQPAGMTEIRVFPNMDGGQEKDPYDIGDGESAGQAEVPAAGQYVDIVECGNWAYQCEVMYKAGKSMLSFITDTSVVCDDGTTGHLSRDGSYVKDNWTVARCFVKELFNKLKESEAEIMALGPQRQSQLQSIPPAWAEWNGYWSQNQYVEKRKMNVPNPFDTVFMQVGVRRLGGKPIIDSAGQPTWQPYRITMLPRGVQNSFYRQMHTPRVPEQPLSVANNMLGDCVGSAGGRVNRPIPSRRCWKPRWPG